MRRETIIRAAEHLKGVASDAVIAWKEGLVVEAADAIGRIQDEIQSTMQDLKKGAYKSIAQLRITATTQAEIEQALDITGAYGEVISIRYVGARDVQPQTSDPQPVPEHMQQMLGDNPVIEALQAAVQEEEERPVVGVGVLYTTAAVGSSERLMGLLGELHSKGFLVRDWKYGCVRRAVA